MLASNDQLSILASAIESAGLVDLLASEEPVTILAPTNAAFEAIPANVFESIVADQPLLTSIIGYHVLPGAASSSDDLVAVGTATTLTGEPVTFADDGAAVIVNDSATICAELGSGSVSILVIDAVLQPPAGLPGGASGSSTPGSSVPAGFDAEQQAVATAFETAVDSSLSYDEQAPFIEDAEALRETIENYPAAADVVMGISAEVTGVSIDGDTAAITYVLSFNGVDAGYGDLDGTMARIDGTWVVPRDEYCAFQAQAFNNCPA